MKKLLLGLKHKPYYYHYIEQRVKPKLNNTKAVTKKKKMRKKQENTMKENN